MVINLSTKCYIWNSFKYFYMIENHWKKTDLTDHSGQNQPLFWFYISQFYLDFTCPRSHSPLWLSLEAPTFELDQRQSSVCTYETFTYVCCAQCTLLQGGASLPLRGMEHLCNVSHMCTALRVLHVSEGQACLSLAWRALNMMPVCNFCAHGSHFRPMPDAWEASMSLSVMWMHELLCMCITGRGWCIGLPHRVMQTLMHLWRITTINLKNTESDKIQSKPYIVQRQHNTRSKNRNNKNKERNKRLVKIPKKLHHRPHYIQTSSCPLEG